MNSKSRARFVVCACFGVFGAVGVGGCDPAPPTSDVLHIQGTLKGPGGDANIDFSDTRSKGEWWPCDARLTAQACVDDEFHVGVFIGRPERQDVSELGGNDCVVEGEPQGAFEILRSKFDDAGTAKIGEDVSAFVLIGSDKNGDQSADVDDEEETRAVAVVSEGTIEMAALNGFEDPFSMRLSGKADGNDVVVDFLGPMSNPALVPGLEPATSCVVTEE